MYMIIIILCKYDYYTRVYNNRKMVYNKKTKFIFRIFSQQLYVLEKERKRERVRSRRPILPRKN